MSGKIWSDKQQEFLLAIDKRINILSGSVRSGKTWVSLLKFAMTVADSPDNYEFLMVGRTLTSLKRNCFGLLQNLVGNDFEYTLSKKEGILYGRKIYLEGANDERAESKIRGMTLGGAYIDELTQIPEDFYKMLLSRLSLPNAKLYATTNPDNPNHYVKKDIIDNYKIDQVNWHFVIDDNIFLDPTYIENIKKEYSGVFYDRFILGLWVIAEGLIYPMYNLSFHNVPDTPRPYEKYWVSIDYGIQNPCVFSLWGLSNGVYYLVKEYYHSGRDSNNQKTDGEYYDEFVKFVGELLIQNVIIDPSATSFITLIRRKGKFSVKEADNSVIDGISECATALKTGLVMFNESCEKSLAEFGLYQWDRDATEDKPVKENDHFMDSFRYFVKTTKIATIKFKRLND